MIEEYLKVIEPKIIGKNVPCIFTNDAFFDPVELHLLETGKYSRGVPKEFGSHPQERKGYRWIRNPFKGTYEDIPIINRATPTTKKTLAGVPINKNLGIPGIYRNE